MKVLVFLVFQIHSGVFILKNADPAINVLMASYNKTQYINHVWWEQTAIMDVLENDAPDVQVGFIAKNRINSYPGDYQAGDYILHATGRKNKHNILQKYIRP